MMPAESERCPFVRATSDSFATGRLPARPAPLPWVWSVFCGALFCFFPHNERRHRLRNVGRVARAVDGICVVGLAGASYFCVKSAVAGATDASDRAYTIGLVGTVWFRARTTSTGSTNADGCVEFYDARDVWAVGRTCSFHAVGGAWHERVTVHADH